MRRTMIGSAALALAVAAVAAAQPPPPQQKQQRPQPQQPRQPKAPITDMNGAAQQTFQEIERTFGFVPQFFRAIPTGMLEPFWEGMKFQGSADTALDPKTKELIGLAVAAQIPCDYCVYFHRQAAQAHGASEAEIREAIGMAAMTRMGSTLLNGLEIEEPQFRREVDRAMRNMRQQARNTASPVRGRSKP